jgi:hypothetical protein
MRRTVPYVFSQASVAFPDRSHCPQQRRGHLYAGIGASSQEPGSTAPIGGSNPGWAAVSYFGRILIHGSERKGWQTECLVLSVIRLCGRNADQRFRSPCSCNGDSPGIHSRSGYSGSGQSPRHEHPSLPSSTRSMGFGE